MSVQMEKAWQTIGHHKYLWTILLFVLIAGFIDENSMLVYWRLNRQNAELSTEIEKWNTEFSNTSAELKRLEQSPAAFNEVARIKLFMKSDNEDVYVVE